MTRVLSERSKPFFCQNPGPDKKPPWGVYPRGPILRAQAQWTAFSPPSSHVRNITRRAGRLLRRLRFLEKKSLTSHSHGSTPFFRPAGLCQSAVRHCACPRSCVRYTTSCRTSAFLLQTVYPQARHASASSSSACWISVFLRSPLFPPSIFFPALRLLSTACFIHAHTEPVTREPFFAAFLRRRSTPHAWRQCFFVFDFYFCRVAVPIPFNFARVYGITS